MPREPLDTPGDLPKEALRDGSNETRIHSHSYGSIGPGLSLGRRAVISLAVAANGALHVKTVVLMTPEEMD